MVFAKVMRLRRACQVHGTEGMLLWPYTENASARGKDDSRNLEAQALLVRTKGTHHVGPKTVP